MRNISDYMPKIRIPLDVEFMKGFGVAIGLVLFLAMLASLYYRPWEIPERQKLNVELSKRVGYSDCCMDLTGIIANGGGITEILVFVKGKAETEFSPSVTPADFYPQGFKGALMGRRVRTMTNVAMSVNRQE